MIVNEADLSKAIFFPKRLTPPQEVSQKEVIKFTCPHCETRLTVPANLAGIEGPCPKCRESICAPKPRVPIPVPSRPTSPQPAAAPQHAQEIPPLPTRPQYTRHKGSWLGLIVPFFFLALTMGVIFTLFFKASPKKSESLPRCSESVRTNPLAPSEASGPVILKPISPEVAPLPTPIVRDQTEEETSQNGELVLQAREVLASFLEASDLAGRWPILTTSHRSDTALAQCSLAGSLPDHSTPLLVHTRSSANLFESFFSITFGKPSPPLTLHAIRTLDQNETKVNTDAFLDAYQQKLLKLAKTPSGKIERSTALISYASFSFDDIPFSDKMALVEFHHSFAKESPPFTKAYVTRSSDTFLKIKTLGNPGDVIPCSLSLGWELEADPERPFLKVLQLDSPGWLKQAP